MTKIDITKPLELSDGTPCRYVSNSCIGGAEFCVRLNNGDYRHFKADGSHVHGELPNLRNVKETTVKTGLEHVERMEALVRRMANWPSTNTPPIDWELEAREIVAELDKGKVSEDDAFAKQQAEHWAPDMITPLASARLVSLEAMAKNCIAKGRELALAEVADKLHEAKYFRAFHLLGLQHAE